MTPICKSGNMPGHPGGLVHSGLAQCVAWPSKKSWKSLKLHESSFLTLVLVWEKVWACLWVNGRSTIGEKKIVFFLFVEMDSDDFRPWNTTLDHQILGTRPLTNYQHFFYVIVYSMQRFQRITLTIKLSKTTNKRLAPGPGQGVAWYQATPGLVPGHPPGQGWPGLARGGLARPPPPKKVISSKNRTTRAMTYIWYVFIILTYTNRNPTGIFHIPLRSLFFMTGKKRPGHPGGLYQTYR